MLFTLRMAEFKPLSQVFLETCVTHKNNIELDKSYFTISKDGWIILSYVKSELVLDELQSGKISTKYIFPDSSYIKTQSDVINHIQ